MSYAAVTMGCDPEFFFNNKYDGIIGAEKIIPSNGILAGGGKIIIDGVQAEINPQPSTCREILAGNISSIFRTLQVTLNKHANTGVDFSQNIRIKKKELHSLDEKNMKFGCAPSNSLYPSTLNLSKIDATKRLNRAAGGHIHLSLFKPYDGLLHKHDKLAVSLLDVLVGNTFVLIDRDPGNISRRKLYGRAGEYRLPKHGLEYRTLSNFWLRHYNLMSLAFGLARTAVQIAMEDHVPTNNNYQSQKLAEAILDSVKLTRVRKAINNNDFDIALENFKNIDFVFKILPSSYTYPICGDTLANFYKFVATVQEQGIAHYFPEDPMTHWVNHMAHQNNGAGYFLSHLPAK